MSINYDLYETKGALNKHYAKVIALEKIDTQKIANHIQQICTVTEHDTKAVLSALAATIKQELLDGNSVLLDGIGTFSLSLSGNIETDKKGNLKLKNAKVKSIKFRPLKSFMNSFNEANFSVKNHMGSKDVNLSNEELNAIIDKLLEKRHSFLNADFRKATGMSRTKATILLNQLVKEGKLKNVGVSTLYIFTK